MHIQCIPARQADEAVWQAADALSTSLPYMGDPMLKPGFARIVAAHRPDTHLLLAWEGETLTAFWPLHLRPGGWARPLGGPFSDWHAPLLGRDTRLDPLDLLQEAGISGITVFGYRPGPGEPLRAGERVGVNLSVLNAPMEEWLETQRKTYPKHFKKMRRMRRNLERDYSEMVFTADDRSAETFDTLIALKRDQYKRTGKHDVLASDWAQGMLADLRALETPDLRLEISSLYIDGRFAAAEANLRAGNVLHGWLVAFEAEFASYSPGYLIVEEVIQSMPSRDLYVYDAGCDRDDYKKYYCNVMSPLDRGVLRAPHSNRTMTRLAGDGWRNIESALPRPAANLMARLRRRTDQIVMAETGFSGRVKGLFEAFARTEV